MINCSLSKNFHQSCLLLRTLIAPAVSNWRVLVEAIPVELLTERVASRICHCGETFGKNKGSYH